MMLVLTCAAHAAASGETLPVARITAEDFGALPFLSGPKLSPNGMKLLASVYDGGEHKLAIIDIAAGTTLSRLFSLPPKRDLQWYRWAGDDRILVSVGQSVYYEGEDVLATRLLTADLKTGQAKFIGERAEGVDGDNV